MRLDVFTLLLSPNPNGSSSYGLRHPTHPGDCRRLVCMGRLARSVQATYRENQYCSF